MVPRFSFPEPSAAERLLSKATRLKIDLWKLEDDDGQPRCCVDVELHSTLELQPSESYGDHALLAELVSVFSKGGAK
jgi:hypothetical protein